MDICNELRQVGILFAKNRFIAVLKKMPMPAMPSVEPHRITGRKPAHDGCNWNLPGAQKKVDVLCEALNYVNLGRALF